MTTSTPTAPTGPADEHERAALATGDRVGRPTWLTALVAGATVLCAALVTFRLGAHGLWFDEGYTMGTVDRPVGDALWRIFHWELNQSPFLVLMIAWQHVGDGEAVLRALPAVFAVAAVPVAYLVGRRLHDRTVGAVAALLLAVHPFVVEWGQQLRAYSLVVLLVLLATLLLLRAVERPSTARIVAYSVVAAVAAYAHFFSLLVLAAHAVSLLALRPLPRRLVAGAGATGAVLLLPLGHYLLTREGDPLYWVSEPTRTKVMATAGDLAGGGRLQLAVYGPAVLLGVVAVASILRASRSHEHAATERWRASLPLLMFLVPPVIALLTSWVAKPVVEARFLIVTVPGLVLVVAIGIRRLRPSVAVVATTALVLVSGVGLWQWYDRAPFEEWREAVDAVGDAAEPGDLVVTSPRRGVHVVGHYLDQQPVPLELGYPDDPDELAPSQVFEVLSVDFLDTQNQQPATFIRWLVEEYDLAEEQHFADVIVRRHVATP